MEIDFNDLDVQEEYFHIFDKVLDAIVLLRYEANKENNTFVSVPQIHDTILRYFSKIDSFNGNQVLRDAASFITAATRKFQKREYYFNTLRTFYQIYKWDKSYLTQEVTSSFYNEILNQQQDFFCQLEKKFLKDVLSSCLPLTEKAEQQFIRTAKLRQTMTLLKEGRQEETPFTCDVILEIKKQAHENIQNMRYFRKMGYSISDEYLDSIDSLFFMGECTIENIASIFPFDLPDKVLKHIRGEYYQLLFPYLDDYSVDFSKISKKNIPYDYQHFVIASHENLLKNKKEVLSLLKKEGLDEFILERKENECFLKLLPFPFLFPEFCMEDFVSILKYSSLISKQFEKRGHAFCLESILMKFHQVLVYAKLYENTTPAIVSVLGEEVTNTVLNGDKMKSKNPRDYLEVYLKMLQQKESSIPPISFCYQDYQFTSGRNSDTSRLLVGHLCPYSCIGPLGSGSEAFSLGLASSYGDVLMITDSNNHLVARSFLFRISNYIVISSFRGEKGIHRQFYQKEVLDLLTQQIFQKANDSFDFLEKIYLVESGCRDLDGVYPTIMDESLTYLMPHCDLEGALYEIGNQKLENDILSSSLYERPREKVSVIYDEESIYHAFNRMRALYYFMTNGLEEKEDNHFEFIDTSCYTRVYQGQDFVIAEDYSDFISVFSLPVNDSRQKVEIDEVMDVLRQEKKGFVKTKKID